MTGFEVWLLAFAVAMDCFAVSIASGIIIKKTLWRTIFLMAFLFGFFQGLMPLVGWLCANSFSHLIQEIDHWFAFVILLFLGGRMVYGSFKPAEERKFDPTRLRTILTLAVATSIDALAVGISFAFLGINSLKGIIYPISVIGFVSFAMSIIGLLIGIKFGSKFAQKIHAEFWGGVILIIIGVKILIEHLS